MLRMDQNQPNEISKKNLSNEGLFFSYLSNKNDIHKMERKEEHCAT